MSKIKKDLLSLVSSSFFNRGLGLLYAVLIRRLLDPPLIGIWNFIEVLKSYLSTVTLGVSYSAEREMPYYRGKGEADQESEARSFLFSYTLLEGFIISGSIILYLYFWGVQHQPELLIGLYFLPFLLIIHKLLNCYFLSLRALKVFKYYSFTNTVFSILDWSLLIYAFYFSLLGVFIGSIINGLIKLLYFYCTISLKHLFKIRLNFSMAPLRAHLPYGVPMSLFKIMFTTLQKADVLFITYLLGTTALGYYYLGVQMATILMEIPAALFYVAYPNMMEKLGKTDDVTLLHVDLKKYVNVLLYFVLPVVVPAAFFGIDFVIYYCLPKFEPGLAAIKIIILVVMFMSLRDLYIQVLMITKRILLLGLITLITSGIFFLSYFFIDDWSIDKLVSVAWAMVTAQIFYSIFSLSCAYLVTRRSVLIHWKECGSQFWVLFYWMAVILCIENFFEKPTGTNGFIDMKIIAMKEITFWLFALPIIYYGMHEYVGNKKFNTLEFLRNFRG